MLSQSTKNNEDFYTEPDYDNPKSIYATNWREDTSSPKQEQPIYGAPFFVHSYSGSFIMPETGFLKQYMTNSIGSVPKSLCGQNGCATLGYDPSLSVSHPGVFSTPDLYYMKKGAVVHVSAECGEPYEKGICYLSTLKNSFYAVYYPLKKNS